MPLFCCDLLAFCPSESRVHIYLSLCALVDCKYLYLRLCLSGVMSVELYLYILPTCYLTTKPCRLSKIIAGVAELAGVVDFADSLADSEVRVCFLELDLVYGLTLTGVCVRAHIYRSAGLESLE
jgi:hypothetical protein